MPHSNNVIQVENQGWDERILVFANDHLVQTFIVVSERYVVIIDTLINEATGAKLLAAAKPYLSASRTLLVINSHADYDHAWGNQIFAGPTAVHPAPIIAHKASPKHFRNYEALRAEKISSDEPEIFGTLKITEPTLLFDNSMVIAGGDLTLNLIYTPGHTDDHIAIQIPEIDTLLAMDSAETPFPFARTDEAIQTMRDSLAKLAALDCETVLYCHAPVLTGKQLILDNIAYFDAIESACQAALDNGLDLDTLPKEKNALINSVGCAYADVVTEREAWPKIDPYYKQEGHTT
ncbi:MAG: MBL fold metallo-hydrolase, partial [Candidatus Promineifilaceae bacterium]